MAITHFFIFIARSNKLPVLCRVAEMFFFVCFSFQKAESGHPVPAQHRAAAQRAGGGRAPDAPERPAQPDGHREGPAGLEAQGRGARDPPQPAQVCQQPAGSTRDSSAAWFV